MQKRKRNHWVPQSYLRRFAADSGGQRVWRLSKEDGQPDLRRIDKVAVRFYLYAPTDERGQRDYSFEERLASLEQWFGHPIWGQLCTDFTDLSWEPLRKMIALLAAVMTLRSPRQFEQVKSLHAQFLDLFERHGIPDEVEYRGKVYPLDPSDYPFYRAMDDDDLKRHWLGDIASAGWLAERFMKMRWSMLFSDRPCFITSDAPVTFMHPSLRFRGLNNPDTSVMFPLSPTRVLTMDNLHQEPDAQYFPLRGDGAETNLLQWRGAIEHMFSSRHPHEVCADFVADAERMGFA